MGSDELERNKEVVRRLHDEAIFGGNLDVMDELIAEDYIQHNPNVPQGREGVRSFFKGLHPHPDLGLHDETMIAEGDFVVRQATYRDGMLIDVYRVQDGQCQEHWDAFRPNPNGQRWEGF